MENRWVRFSFLILKDHIFIKKRNFTSFFNNAISKPNNINIIKSFSYDLKEKVLIPLHLSHPITPFLREFISVRERKKEGDKEISREIAIQDINI